MGTTYVEAEPRAGLDASDCVFYHSVDLPFSGRHEGIWDLVGRFDDYTGHQQFDGKTVLDVGTATGFLTFEAETRGATVTSFDVPDASFWQWLPIPGSEFVEDHGSWRSNIDAILDRMKNSYWLCHEEFASTARCLYGSVYEFDEPRYDVVLLGQILVHLRDAFSALAAAARVCNETLIVVEGNLPEAAPIAGLCARADNPDITYAWYHYSHGWYREVLKILGFRKIEITTGRYKCNDPSYPSKVELATVVARR